MDTPPIANWIYAPSVGLECRAAGRIVLRTMRRAAFFLLVTAACYRPALYYPASAPASVPSNAPTAAANPSATPSASPALSTVARVTDYSSMSDVEYMVARGILLPVAGADIARVPDSFYEPRDTYRIHHALDIFAPRGTPIISADDGVVLRMTTTTLGGISMYVVDTQARLVYYYAHLERYNDAVRPGNTIARGDTLGFVGTTGNAPKNLPHLHFQVMRFPVDGRFWNGEPVNPFNALGGIPRGERNGAGGRQPKG